MISPGYFGIPEVNYDSWLTIGGSGADEGVEVNLAAGEINLLEEFA